MSLPQLGTLLILGWLVVAVYVALVVAGGGTKHAIREAHRYEDFDIVAAKTLFDLDELRQLLTLPSNPSANMVAEDPDYLWRSDDAKEAL